MVLYLFKNETLHAWKHGNGPITLRYSFCRWKLRCYSVPYPSAAILNPAAAGHKERMQICSCYLTTRVMLNFRKPLKSARFRQFSPQLLVSAWLFGWCRWQTDLSLSVIAPANKVLTGCLTPGNLLEFNWSCWNFMTHPVINLAVVGLLGKCW